jgi:hypothetical protein
MDGPGMHGWTKGWMIMDQGGDGVSDDFGPSTTCLRFDSKQHDIQDMFVHAHERTAPKGVAAYRVSKRAMPLHWDGNVPVKRLLSNDLQQACRFSTPCDRYDPVLGTGTIF